VTIVHGDYRSGNFLVGADADRAGKVIAVLDWEMVHAGDPLEDLAWAMDPLWSHGTGRAAATLSDAEAIACWEEASGLRCDPAALAWWRVFAQVQGVVIWVSSAAEIARGRSHDPVLAFAGVLPYRFHVLTLARTLRAAA
jgi:aminoglycoside phosphotransferase (APT) family kinase protein